MTGYFGSKAALGLYQNIIAMMPPHDTYIETHLGGGAVMRNKPPARNNIAIDIDPEPLESFDCRYLVQKVNDCAHRYLREYDYAGSELIYCDPPYLIETRTSKRRYRQRIKRKAERWARNYQALPPAERLALLAAIMAVETD